MANRGRYKIKEFHLTWNIQKFFSIFDFSTAISSPSIRISASNSISFTVSQEGEKFFFSVDRSENLKFELVGCEVSFIGAASVPVVFSKTGSLFPRGWTFRCTSHISTQRMAELANGHLEIKCYLFIGELINTVSGISLEDVNLLKLTRDIKKLHNCEKFSDICLQAGEHHFKVHKAVLFARSPQLIQELRLFEDPSETKMIHNLSPAVLKVLLEYFYTSRLELVNMNMPSGLVLAVDTLKLHKLKEKLCAFPNESTIVTRMVETRTTLNWPIPNFSLHFAENSKLTKISPILCSSYSNQYQMELCLEISKLKNKSKAEVQIIVSSRWHSEYPQCKCNLKSKASVVDIFGELQHSYECEKPVEKSQENELISTWNSVFSINKAVLDSNSEILLPKDTLTLMFDFHMSKPEHEVRESSFPSTSLEHVSFGIEDSQTLSNNLMDLYTSKKFSDITLCVDDKRFEVHKIILCSRAPRLVTQLDEDPSIRELVINDIDSDTMRDILVYIYSGNIQQSNCGVATRLYLAAYKYELPLLMRNCLSYVKSNLTF